MCLIQLLILFANLIGRICNKIFKKDKPQKPTNIMDDIIKFNKDKKYTID